MNPEVDAQGPVTAEGRLMLHMDQMEAIRSPYSFDTEHVLALLGSHKRLRLALTEIVNQWPHSEYCHYITQTAEGRVCNCFLHVARKALDGRP